MPLEQPEPNETKPHDIINLCFNVAACHVACLAPFVRSRFGVRAFASYGWALLLMLVYSEGRQCPLLAWYTVPWMVMIAYRRLTADPDQHSAFQGYPWVFGWMADYTVARMGECFICFGLAVYFTINEQEAMADFFMAMIVSLLVTISVERAAMQGRKRTIKDAEIMSGQANQW